MDKLEARHEPLQHHYCHSLEAGCTMTLQLKPVLARRWQSASITIAFALCTSVRTVYEAQIALCFLEFDGALTIQKLPDRDNIWVVRNSPFSCRQILKACIWQRVQSGSIGMCFLIKIISDRMKSSYAIDVLQAFPRKLDLIPEEHNHSFLKVKWFSSELIKMF